MTKYVFVTGGVMSSVGKGIVAASIAKILSVRGYKVTAIKIDPYLNVDAGTMSPYQHGETFVTYDGGETDLDIGHYERFLDIDLPKQNNITSGQIYFEVINKERLGEYLGQTVQLIPHVTDEIKRRINIVSKGFDVAVVEIGGTVGDYEQLPFLEAARQMRVELGARNTVFVHVALVPRLSTTGEFKTKPLQHSVVELRRIGIQPDVIVARAEKLLDEQTVRKIALFTNVPVDSVFTSYDVDTVYKVPKVLEGQGLGWKLVELLGLERREPKWDEWDEFLANISSAEVEFKVLMCGKYTRLHDSYISIVEAIRHAAAWRKAKPLFEWCESDLIEKNPEKLHDYSDVHAVLVLPGFGRRGAEGMIECVRFARENRIPFLGICFGMQLSVVEISRNLLNLKDANSVELDPDTPHPVIHLAPEQRGLHAYGGTMILGDREVEIVEGTKLHKLYGSKRALERHRHRYEVNLAYLNKLESVGVVVAAWRKDVRRVEAIELREDLHPFFIATQYHPEFKSRPLRPHPVYVGLVDAAISVRVARS